MDAWVERKLGVKTLCSSIETHSRRFVETGRKSCGELWRDKVPAMFWPTWNGSWDSSFSNSGQNVQVLRFLISQLLRFRCLKVPCGLTLNWCTRHRGNRTT